MSSLAWFVAHTRPRREKKLKDYCDKQGIPATLPCYRTVHNYRGKTVTFKKPLFPGYLFLQLLSEQPPKIRQNDHLAALLAIPDQESFVLQLGAVLKALETELEIRLAPQIAEGTRVAIRSGPLRGLEGWVEKRYGMTTVLLRLDFISQAAAVTVRAEDLEPL